MGPTSAHTHTLTVNGDRRVTSELPTSGFGTFAKNELGERGSDFGLITDAHWPGSTSLIDPGCVKTREAVVSAQQEDRTCGLGESLMREQHSVRINLVPERPAE